ncbi:hypothetical protein PR048_006720 [Dryococelus australis]|uniref:Uncharacterized protein n=1 Tax=Dryococelus australis TaxID=614101 RepID=A0ABQ9IBR0_9NEOP|nr:hypothetical protein PR048_006720 [Dryococelus australis]
MTQCMHLFLQIFPYRNMITQLSRNEESKIKEAVKDQAIVILCDETKNCKGECVFVVLFRILLASGEYKMLAAGAKVLFNGMLKSSCGHSIEIILVLEILLHIQYWVHKLNIVENIVNLLP